MNITALIIKETDNVGVTTAVLNKGDIARFKRGDAVVEVTLLDNIPIYHKFCVSPIAKGQPIIKYGEQLGLASKDIAVGNYVHSHNLESQRNG